MHFQLAPSVSNWQWPTLIPLVGELLLCKSLWPRCEVSGVKYNLTSSDQGQGNRLKKNPETSRAASRHIELSPYVSASEVAIKATNPYFAIDVPSLKNRFRLAWFLALYQIATKAIKIVFQD